MSGGVVPGCVPAKTRAAHCLSPPITSRIDPPRKHILQPDTQAGVKWVYRRGARSQAGVTARRGRRGEEAGKEAGNRWGRRGRRRKGKGRVGAGEGEEKSGVAERQRVIKLDRLE